MVDVEYEVDGDLFCRRGDYLTMKSITARSFITAMLISMSSQAAAWTVHEDFEGDDNFVGTAIDTQHFDGFSGTAYSDVQSVSGGLSARMSIAEGSDGWAEWGAVINHPSKLTRYDELWLRVHAFFPDGFSYQADPWLKFLRVHTLKPDGSNIGYIDWYVNNDPDDPSPYRWIYEGQQMWSTFGASDDQIRFDLWATYEMYMKFDTVPASQGGNAIVRVWKDGKLLKEITDGITLSQADAYSHRSLIFTYWNGTAPKTQHMYIDDVVLTTDQPSARDAQGNPMIGAGEVSPAPSAPADVIVD